MVASINGNGSQTRGGGRTRSGAAATTASGEEGQQQEQHHEDERAGNGGDVGDELETDDADAVGAPSTDGAGELGESSWRAQAEAASAKNARLKRKLVRESTEKREIESLVISLSFVVVDDVDVAAALSLSLSPPLTSTSSSSRPPSPPK